MKVKTIFEEEVEIFAQSGKVYHINKDNQKCLVGELRFTSTGFKPALVSVGNGTSLISMGDHKDKAVFQSAIADDIAFAYNAGRIVKDPCDEPDY